MSNPEAHTDYINPETDNPIDYGEKLRELYLVDDGLAETHRPQVWEIAQKVASSLVDPRQQQAVQIYAGIIDWQMFGKPGGPLPYGLLLYQDGEGQIISHDTDIPYLTYTTPSAVGREFEKLGMAAIGQAIDDERSKKQAEIQSTLTEFIKQTPEYQLFASFDKPERQVQPEPLNAYWRQVRQTQIEHEVRDLYGYDPGTAIPPGTPAGHDLTRRLYHLDDETRPQTSQLSSGRNGLKRAQNYLKPYIADILNEGQSESTKRTSIDIYHDTDFVGDTVIAFHEANGDRIEDEFYDYIYTTGYKLSDKLYTGPADLHYVSAIFTGQAINQIFHTDTHSIEDALQKAITSSLDILDDHARAMLAGEALAGYPGYMDLLLKAPVGDVIKDRAAPTEDFWHDTSWSNAFQRRTQLATLDDLLRARQRTEGVVEKYGPDKYRTAARLILKNAVQLLPETPVKPEKFHNSVDEDVIIDLYGHDPQTQPFIPGYKLVSSNGKGRYGFETDNNGDQYAPCTVTINKKRRANLASEYHAIGLQSLADQIESRKSMTVDDLVKLVRNQTVYHLPGSLPYFSAGEDDPLEKRFSITESISDFKDQVRQGKLYAQCTGSAQFLRYSLEEAFGPGSAGVIEGLTINDSGRLINGVGHAQTVFSHKGRQYIVDATAPHHLSGNPHGQGHSNGYKSNDRHAAKTPEVTPPKAPEIKNTYEAPKPKTTEEKLDDLITSFSEQAKVAFDLPNDRRLKEFLVKLPPQDPARRTYEMLRQYRNGRIDTAELEQRSHYVERCAKANRDIRRKLGIDHYSQTFLDQLKTTARHAQFIVRDISS